MPVMILLRNLERKTCFIATFSCCNNDGIMISYPTLRDITAVFQQPSWCVSDTVFTELWWFSRWYFTFSFSVCPAILQELLPLVLSFELPAIMQSDPSSPTVQHISQTYNLTVSFKPPTRLYRATGVVRGSQNNANAVKVRMVMLDSERDDRCFLLQLWCIEIKDWPKYWNANI